MMEIKMVFRYGLVVLVMVQLFCVVDGAFKSSCSSRKTSAVECKEWCEKSERCSAYTYYPDLHRCLPKNKDGWKKVNVQRAHSGLAHDDHIEENVEYQGGDMDPPCPTREML